MDEDNDDVDGNASGESNLVTKPLKDNHPDALRTQAF